MSGTPIFAQLVDELGHAPASAGGLTYSRFVPTVAGSAALLDTEVHVRAHLSAIADADDDPETSFDDVQVTHEQRPDGVLIVGHLPGARPIAEYLQPGHDPLAGVDPDLVREVLGGSQ